MKKHEKTNVMRILDKLGLDYKVHCYTDTDAVSGTEVAETLGQNPECVFKTLVTSAKNGIHYVFMIPVKEELDLKKAAACVNEKAVSMIKSKDLLPVTGYIHGGCSPIGMKKQFVTVIHKTAPDFETIFFSAGKIGYQIEMNFNELKKAVDVKTADIIVKK